MQPVQYKTLHLMGRAFDVYQQQSIEERSDANWKEIILHAVFSIDSFITYE